jgi:hypothetical protein
MRRYLILSMVLLATVVFVDAANADDWMFHGSAYSHSPKWGREVGPNRFSRGPYYTPQYGGYYRSGYRHLYGNGGGWGGGWGGGCGGGSGDFSNYFESWWQTGGQFIY